jgi:hypothetical protein
MTTRLCWFGMPFVIYAVGSALGVAGASGSESTTNPSVFVAIHVTITDSKVAITPKSEPRGSTARFIVSNMGSKSVSFSVGSKSPGLGIRFGFRTLLRPGVHRTLLLYLGTRGLVPYYVGGSYGAAKASQRGQLIVGATCSVCAPPGPPLPP